MTTRLFDIDTRPRGPRWTGNVLPVVYTGPLSCTVCGSHGSVVRLAAYTTVPLFRMYGRGEAQRRHPGLCDACGAVTILQVESVNPRRI